MKLNDDIIEEYSKFLKLENKSSNTIHVTKCSLRKLSKDLKKPFKEANETEIISHLNNLKSPLTRQIRLMLIKRFYRWLFKLNDNELPDFLKRLKPIKYEKDEIKYRERVITENEYNLLIANANNLKHKAIMETLYKFGIRLSELLSMKVGDVFYDGQFTQITVRESKTKTRDVITHDRADFLMNWIEIAHSRKEDNKAYVFYATETNPNKKYTKNAVQKIIERITSKSGIQRKISPHDFRHTSITRARDNGIPNTHIETNHGLVKGSRQMITYDHNKLRDFKEWYNKRDEQTKPSYDRLKKLYEDELNELKKQTNEIMDMFQTLGLTNYNGGLYEYDQQSQDYTLINWKGGPNLPKLPKRLDKDKKPIGEETVGE